MRKLSFLWMGLTISGPAFSQVIAWEKMVAPGLSYRMEVDNRTPRVVHALRWSLGAPALFARSEVAQMRLFSAPGADAREELTALMQRSGAIAGINGDFFPTSGDPLGAMVRDGQLLSRPFPGRASVGWGANSAAMGLLQWQGSATIDTLPPINLEGINEDLPQNRIVLYTDASVEIRATQPSIFLMVRMDTLGFAPTGAARGQIMEVLRNQATVQVPSGYAVLAAQGTAVSRLAPAFIGANVRFSMQTTGFDWTKIDNVMSGGPSLVRNGQVQIDFQTASFSKSFAETRHPRTAVGRTAQNDLWFVAVDGRQPMSAGASLEELATIMRGLGCTDAVNLDGGGSTTLAIFGQVLNRPSDGRERKISNAILFFGPRPEATGEEMAIQGPATVPPASLNAYRLMGSDGKPVPDRDVLWSAMGAGGWVDQSGTLRSLQAGTVVIRAFSRGKTSSLTVNVAAPAPAPTGNTAQP